MKLLISFVNKVGAVYNYLSSIYWDRKIAQNNKEMTLTLAPCQSGATSCQSISYPMLRLALRYVDLSQYHHIVDVGSGFGRLLLYVEYISSGKKLEGYEINKTAAAISAKLCNPKGIVIKNSDILMEPIQGDLFILNNPFSGKVLGEFITQLAHTAPATVLYMNPYDDHVQELNRLKNIACHIEVIHKPLMSVDRKRIGIIEVH